MRHRTALVAMLASVLLPASASAIETRIAEARAPLLPIALSSTTETFATLDTWRFDGSWYVVLFCPETESAYAYAYRFTAQVKDGVLHAERGQPGAGGWMQLDGAIQPDGSARLNANGITNDADDLRGITAQERSYAYEVAARFEGSHGLGGGIERRLCNLHFTRQ